MPTPAKYALRGTVVTMDAGRVLDDAVVYIDAAAGRIAALRPPNSPAPAGFASAPVVNTAGTIYPGLIELHNHLPYNILTLWRVPKAYGNRDQWPNHADYGKLVTGPMQTLGRVHASTYLAAIVRYVEAKCLMGGVTTSQGITLSGVNPQEKFRGNLRNVENTFDPRLPDAYSKTGDVERGRLDAFAQDLARSSCYLLHLSEGRQGNDKAIERFDRLRRSDGTTWVLSPALAGIHSSALRPQDLDILRRHGASIVWSPFSNLLLYGTTAEVAHAKRIGLTIGLGSDWAPTGTKNLLGEMKVARLFSRANGNLFSDEEIVQMATVNAARILQWHNAAGQVKEGFAADLMVLARRTGDPYSRLIEATEADIALVTIAGAARYGRRTHMTALASAAENWTVAGRPQAFEFETGAPIAITLTLRQAASTLADGLRRLPELARTTPPAGGGVTGMVGVAPASLGGSPGAQQSWTLDLHDDTDAAFFASGAASFKDVAVPLPLDPLTVVDDPDFLANVKNQRAHVPAWLRNGLETLY